MCIQNRTSLQNKRNLEWRASECPPERNARFPKLNRMPDAGHFVKVETQVVNGVQDLRKYLVGRIKMPQVASRVAAAHPAGAVRIERSLVSGVARLFD